jgi:hypothetical protein
MSSTCHNFQGYSSTFCVPPCRILALCTHPSTTFAPPTTHRHIYIGRAQITLRAVLVALGTQLSGVDALFTGLDIARMVALVALIAAAAMALVMAVVETGYNTKRHAYGE